MFVVSIISSFLVGFSIYSYRQVIGERLLANAINLLEVNNPSIESLNLKVDFMLSNFTQFGRFDVVGNVLIGILVFLFSFLLFSVIVTILNNKLEDPSFILLTKESSKQKQQILHSLKRSWISFLVTQTLAILIGIGSNLLTNFFFLR